MNERVSDGSDLNDLNPQGPLLSFCRFGFPWEIGMYWNLTVGGLNQRAVGCPGLDEPFGTIDKSKDDKNQGN